MELLLWIGSYLLWALISLVSGIIGGYGLAAGFDGFKRTKEWLEVHKSQKKNNTYLSELEEQFIGSATTEV